MSRFKPSKTLYLKQGIGCKHETVIWAYGFGISSKWCDYLN